MPLRINSARLNSARKRFNTMICPGSKEYVRSASIPQLKLVFAVWHKARGQITALELAKKIVKQKGLHISELTQHMNAITQLRKRGFPIPHVGHILKALRSGAIEKCERLMKTTKKPMSTNELVAKVFSRNGLKNMKLEDAQKIVTIAMELNKATGNVASLPKRGQEKMWISSRAKMPKITWNNGLNLLNVLHADPAMSLTEISKLTGRKMQIFQGRGGEVTIDSNARSTLETLIRKKMIIGKKKGRTTYYSLSPKTRRLLDESIKHSAPVAELIELLS